MSIEQGADVVTRTNEKIRRDRRRRRKRLLLIVSALVAVLVALVSFIAHRPALRVASISILGTETLSESDLQEVVQERIGGKFLYLFPRDTIPFVSQRTLEHDIVRAYPRVETIDISIEDRDIRVLVGERKASYLWCGPVPFAETRLSQSCYYFDKSGFIFDSAPYFSAAVYFTLYDTVEAGGETDPIGKYVLHHDGMESLLSFIASLEPLGIRGFALALTDNEATLYLGASRDEHAPRLIWNIDDDYALLGSNLQSALGVEPMKSEVQGGESHVDYIDLRYQDKVYYKLKN